MLRVSILFIAVLALLTWWLGTSNTPETPEIKSINGVNLEAPRNPVGAAVFSDITQLNANWVAVIP